MLGLLRAFSTMFKNSENTIPAAIAIGSPAAGIGFSDAPRLGEFAELSARLGLARQLLIVPTPGSVCQVGLVLEDVQGRMAKLNREPGKHDPDQVRSLQGELGRVRSLVEGALRMQWAQMRDVMALTQSYSPGGRVSHWQPPVPKVDLKV
jgi:hypothetical protein